MKVPTTAEVQRLLRILRAKRSASRQPKQRRVTYRKASEDQGFVYNGV